MKTKQSRSSREDVGFMWDTCPPVLQQKAQRMGWALCVGAGSSRGAGATGVFPEWSSLVDRLVAQDRLVAKPRELSTGLKADFSADALVEAAKDRLGLSHENFIKRLQALLYEDLVKNAGTDWSTIATGLTAASPAGMSLRKWETFIHFFDHTYPGLSALQIARVIADTAGSECEPSAVLSFNAEPLLYALINARLATSQSEKKPPKSLRMFNRVSRGISYQEAGRLPYIFCHGLLEVDGGSKIFSKSAASTEKLVFSEAEYLQVANTAFSWQASLFVGTAILRSLVFVGLSFTDPNLRRWLAAVHTNRVEELRLKGNNNPPYEHYWLNKDPKNDAKKRWIESLVRHLGVRLIWIDDWSRVEECLRKMLAIE